MNEYQIRPCELSESRKVNKLFMHILGTLDYYNEIAKETESSKYTPELLATKIRDDEYSVAVALDGDKIIGFCFSRKDDFTIWIEWFAVSEDYRRKGIGTSFLRFLESTAKQRSAHKLWCDCRTNNEKSANALISYGFKKIGTVENHWYGQDFYLWHKLVQI